MERNTPSDASLREKWEGSFILHTESMPGRPSPVQPEQVFPVIDETVMQHGRNIGRAVFQSIFPQMENLFDDRYGRQAPEVSADAA